MVDENTVGRFDDDPKIGVQAVVVAALVAELVTLLAFYRFALFGILDAQPAANFCVSYVFSDNVCHTLAGLAPTILLMGFALGVLSVLLPRQSDPVRSLIGSTPVAQPSLMMVTVNLVGLILIIVPYLLVITLETPQRLLLQVLWSVGPLLLVGPIIKFAVSDTYIIKNLKLYQVAVLLFVGLAPELSSEIDKRLWVETFLQHGTMVLVLELLQLLGEPNFYTPPHIIGVQAFSVAIGFPCAGLSGIMFSAGLVTLFLMLSWQVIDIRRAIILIPIAALFSWLANSVRITILLLIGEYISPQLAVDGFHSYAGWISLVLISSLTMYIAVKLRWFHREGVVMAPRSSALYISHAVYLVPFTVFMFTLILVGAVSNNPDALYPFRITVVAVSLLFFWRSIPDDFELPNLREAYFFPALALAIFWIWHGSADGKPISAVLPNATDLEEFTWMAFRIAGTVLVVPIVEELFFRGYLQEKISKLLNDTAWLALLVTSVFFALLHSHFILAFAAGVLFGWVKIKTGKLITAIACHALCNACIVVWALTNDNWAVI